MKSFRVNPDNNVRCPKPCRMLIIVTLLGITLWERGWQIMKHLGVEADMDGLLQTPRSDAEGG